MDVLRIASSSRQYVKAQVSATVNGVAANPTSDVVKIAFVATGVTPQSSDMQTASWETDATVTPNRYYARILIGPGGDYVVPVGLWHMWIQVTDSPEIPVIWSGIVKVV